MECAKNVCPSERNTSSVDPYSKLKVKWIIVAGRSFGSKEKAVEWWVDSHGNKQERTKTLLLTGRPETDLANPSVRQSNIAEIHLDSVFSDKAAGLSLEIFKCVNVQVLSLRRNNLVSLPAEIGRLSQLRTLILTDNYLTINAIPFTLTFCKHLNTLYLDHNYLDALPGFLLDMPQLETVYRHGNHNDFKSTFMWYHSAKRERVMPLRPNRVNNKSDGTLHQPHTLESHSTRALIATKINFFTPGLLPVTLQEYVAKTYTKYKICAYCSDTFYESKAGFRVFIFKSPYLGNTCVPFEHWTCSRACGVALEEPAFREERDQAKEEDKQYQRYTESVQRQFSQKSPRGKGIDSCVIA